MTKQQNSISVDGTNEAGRCLGHETDVPRHANAVGIGPGMGQISFGAISGEAITTVIFSTCSTKDVATRRGGCLVSVTNYVKHVTEGLCSTTVHVILPVIGL